MHRPSSRVSHEMLLRSNRIRRRSPRSPAGSQMADFAAALVILVVVIFIPLLDLTILPIRWMLAREIINDYSRKLALCETFSESYALMKADPSLATRLLRLGGVECKDINLQLRISRVFLSPHPDEYVLIEGPRTIPTEWLPGGKKSPCTYSLELKVTTLISPAFLMSGIGLDIPGLTSPVPFEISSAHEWENLARNPISKKYYLNE